MFDSLSLNLPTIVVGLLACMAYATFLWINFRQGKYVMLWSSAGIILIQSLYAFGSPNIPAALAAAGFHGALVGCIFAMSRLAGDVPSAGGRGRRTLVRVPVRKSDHK